MSALHTLRWLAIAAPLAASACEETPDTDAPIEQPAEPAVGEEQTAGTLTMRPGCGPVPRPRWGELTVTGPRGGVLARLSPHMLWVADGVVPAGQTYVFRLEEDPEDAGVLIGTRRPAGAPLNRPPKGEAPFTLRIHHGPCGNQHFIGIWENGVRLYGADASQPGRFVQAPMATFGSTYAAAAPVLIGQADTTDTTGSREESGFLDD